MLTLFTLAVVGSAVFLLSACSATQLLTEVQSRVEALNRKVYAVGDTGPAGGTVFYDKGVYSNQWQYLEVAPYDQTTVGASAPWDSSAAFSLLGASGTGIGTGKSNTDIIVAALGPGGGGRPLGSFAAGVCASLTLNGFSDWFLPSKDELNQLWVHRDVVGAITYSYWSSTESDATTAYVEDLTTGIATTNSKTNTPQTRAIRRF